MDIVHQYPRIVFLWYHPGNIHKVYNPGIHNIQHCIGHNLEKRMLLCIHISLVLPNNFHSSRKNYSCKLKKLFEYKIINSLILEGYKKTNLTLTNVCFIQQFSNWSIKSKVTLIAVDTSCVISTVFTYATSLISTMHINR